MGYTEQPNHDSSTVGSGPYSEHGFVQGEEKSSHSTSTQPSTFPTQEQQQRGLNNNRTKKPSRGKGHNSRNFRKNRGGPKREKEDGTKKDGPKQADEATKALMLETVGETAKEVASQPAKIDVGVNKAAEITNAAAKGNVDSQKVSETDRLGKQMNNLSVE